ncbi:MAG: GNAT family N-acetyltransferase [Chloroflexota bacterium]
MMQLSYRPYKDEDLSLLQEYVMLWRSQAPYGTYCHAGDIPHRLYNGNRGLLNLSEITRIYTLDDTIVAFLLAHPRQDFINVLINPDFIAQHDLLLPIINDGYQILDSNPLNKADTDRTIAIECFADDDALKQLLSRAGFSEAEEVLVLTRHNLQHLADVQLPDGFSIRHTTMQDAEQLALVHNDSFGSDWTANLYRNEVMLKPGYKPEEEYIVVAPDGNFAAFTKIWIDSLNKVGLFEPVGTHKDYRRKGLARSLMTYIMKHMHDMGLQEAEVCYEVDNSASQALYTGLGFEVRHHITDWAKTVNQEKKS